jgi:catechol 2,3-dioxygenase-like lactoylglutathione lyase family enzyme
VPYTVKHHYHSTLFVPSLDEATRFFDRVFGRESKILGEYLRGGKERGVQFNYSTDYATFTPIAEVQLECVDPTLLVIDGAQTFESVTEPHLGSLAWFVDGIEDLWTEMRRRDLRGTDMADRVYDGDECPLDVSSTPIIFTLAAETGLSYEFTVFLPHRDPRGDPPVHATIPVDPLGIECCSHHTVLTDQKERALTLLVDVLGGRVVHEGRNDLLGTQSTFVALADGVIELGQPVEEGSPAMLDWRQHAPDDAYHALTWKVRDLDQAAAHLEAAGVGVRARTATAIVTDPAESLGVAWGFSSELVPGDPRR